MTGNALEVAQQNAKNLMFNSSKQLDAMLPRDQQGQVNGFIGSAFAALTKDPNLLQAANNAPETLIAALNSAAQRGLQPGTEEYYLTPRKNKGRMEILGIIGYQGLVTLMYRSGAVSSVTVEAVHANDEFRWAPGQMEKPLHSPNWFGDRGEIIGAYAYATMKDGSTSKVVIVDQARIATAKAASAGSSSPHSPWNKHYKAMVLKTAAHDLAKWVPTSAVDKTVQNAQAVVGEQNAQVQQAAITAKAPAPQEVYDDGYFQDIQDEPQAGEPAPSGELVGEAAQAEIIKRARAKWGVQDEGHLNQELEGFFMQEGLTLGALTVEQGNQVLAALAK